MRVRKAGRLESFLKIIASSAVLGMSTLSFGAEQNDLAARLANHLQPHPRLLLPGGGLAQFRSSNDARLTKLRERLLLDADAILQQPPLERKLDGIRLLAVSRDALHRVATLALAYRMTGQNQYLLGAKTNLATVVQFTDFNPKHFLDVAEMSAALAIGYDWLYDELTVAERTAIRITIVDKCLKPSLVLPEPWWVRSHNNWNQVCNGGLVLGALAVADEERDLSSKIAALALEALPVAMQHYAPDGAYPEGASYWEYGTTYNLLMIAALTSAMGTDFGLLNQPGFLATADYHLHLVGPTGLNFSYSDGTEKTSWLPAASAFYLADRRQDQSLLFNEVQAMDRLMANKPPTGKGGADAWLWLLALWAKNSAATPPAVTHYLARGEMPVATHRSGWDADATFVAIKGGSASASHAHMDVGSFCLDAGGVRWAGDLGLQDYGGLEAKGLDLWDFKQNSTRWSVFRLGSMSHNVLTVNGQDQRVDGHASIVQSDDNRTVVDLTTVYANELAEAKREIQLRPEGLVQLSDRLKALPGKPANVRWAMVTHAEVQISGAKATLRSNGKTFDITARSPNSTAFKVIPAAGRRPFDQANPHAKLLTLEFTVAAGESTVLEICFVPTGSASKISTPK